MESSLINLVLQFVLEFLEVWACCCYKPCLENLHLLGGFLHIFEIFACSGNAAAVIGVKRRSRSKPGLHLFVCKQLGLTSLFANMFSIQVEPCHNEHDHDDDDNVGGDDDDHDD